MFSNITSALKKYQSGVVIHLILLLTSLIVGCYNVSNTGALWPDAPQYANAAVMIHNWLRSGEWLNPLDYAARQYAQYPAFHLPFHPPIYPGLLALFFSFTGASYLSARLFVALCLWLSAYFFYQILKHFEVDKFAAFACSLLFITTPEIARWSRDTMSEIPGMALIMIGTYFFLKWLDNDKNRFLWLAFGFAEAAFLSRVTTAGLILAWFVYLFVSGNTRKLRNWQLLLLTIAYLSFNVLWTIFVSSFAKLELGAGDTQTQTTVVERILKLFSTDHIFYYLSEMPRMMGWALLLLALLSAVYAIKIWRNSQVSKFWSVWILSYCIFLFVIRLVPEPRYFIYALPGFAGLIAVLFSPAVNKILRKRLAFALTGLCLIANTIQISSLPVGTVGYDTLAERAAMLEKPGNIMSLCPMNQDFIFRFQVSRSPMKRSIVRGDRTLAIRLDDYGGFSGGVKSESVVLAKDYEDVLDTLRKGRIKYLLTCVPDTNQTDKRTAEMRLGHQTAESLPNSFRLLEKFPLIIDFENQPSTEQIHLWEFLEELPEGTSELPVRIPTAEMELRNNE